MTDNDIMKALACCAAKGTGCRDCPAFVAVDRSVCREAFAGALDLIDRQKAEIERIRIHAVKEFAKVLVDRAQDGAVPVCDLSDIVAEWLGGDDHGTVSEG